MPEESRNKSVLVLMSAYDGAAYISEQIDSIFAQKMTRCRLALMIRDDGSNDGGATREVIAACMRRYPERITFYAGENIGVCASFFDLVRRADFSYDYFAFADQDDYWLPHKIQSGLDAIAPDAIAPDAIAPFDGVPAVYSAQIKAVDANLNELKGHKGKKAASPSLGNALIENIVTGCTAMFNKAMLTQLQKVSHTDTADLFLHDWTLYLIAMSFGRWVYDPKPAVLYRQHSQNALGAAGGWRGAFARKYRLFVKYAQSDLYRKNLQAFLRVYADALTDGQKDLFNAFIQKKESAAHYLRFVRLLAAGKITRQSKLETVLFGALLLLNIL